MGSILSRVVATATVLLSLAGAAHGGLVAGDIAIVGVNTDEPDSFAWIPLVDLAPGQEIKFTDAGWVEAGNFSLNEGLVTYTTPLTGISAGTLLTFTRPGSGSTVGDYTLSSNGSSGSFDLSRSSGDQVIAFTGPVNDPTFLFAVQTNSNQFQTGTIQSGTSAVPLDLTENLTAVAVGTGSAHNAKTDNAFYNGVVTSGTREELLAAIGNQANWVKSGDPFDLTKGAALPGGGMAQYSVQGGVSAVPEPGGLFVGTLVLGISAVIGGVIGARKWRAAT